MVYQDSGLIEIDPRSNLDLEDDLSSRLRLFL